MIPALILATLVFECLIPVFVVLRAIVAGDVVGAL